MCVCVCVCVCVSPCVWLVPCVCAARARVYVCVYVYVSICVGCCVVTDVGLPAGRLAFSLPGPTRARALPGGRPASSVARTVALLATNQPTHQRQSNHHTHSHTACAQGQGRLGHTRARCISSAFARPRSRRPHPVPCRARGLGRTARQRAVRTRQDSGVSGHFSRQPQQPCQYRSIRQLR